MQTYTLTFTEADLKKLDYCLFTLNYLANCADELDEIRDGLASVVERSSDTITDLSGLFYGAVCTQCHH